MADLTDSQRKALAFVVQEGNVTPAQLARLMWPDSPAWHRRTKGRRTGTIAGAVGGTMPMLGAKVLWALLDKGYVMNLEHNIWEPTIKGKAVLE